MLPYAGSACRRAHAPLQELLRIHEDVEGNVLERVCQFLVARAHSVEHPEDVAPVQPCSERCNSFNVVPEVIGELVRIARTSNLWMRRSFQDL